MVLCLTHDSKRLRGEENKIKSHYQKWDDNEPQRERQDDRFQQASEEDRERLFFVFLQN